MMTSSPAVAPYRQQQNVFPVGRKSDFISSNSGSSCEESTAGNFIEEEAESYWHPMKPAYRSSVVSPLPSPLSPNLLHNTTATSSRQRFSVTSQNNPGIAADEMSFKLAIPAMIRPIAILCAILNFLLPGFGLHKHNHYDHSLTTLPNVSL